MEQILQAYGLPTKFFTAIMMLYRNIKAKVHTPNGDKDFFNIVAGVLQGDMLAHCLDYIPQISIDIMKENNFTLKTDNILQKL